MMNFLLDSDSYKYSHFAQYPKNEGMFSYIEAREGEEVKFFGLQYIIKKMLMKMYTKDDIKEAKEIITAHGLPFNEKGFEELRTLGYFPLKIKAVKEGSVYPVQIPLVSIQSTDARFGWLVGFIETFLLRLWYPTTVATNSYKMKKVVLKYTQNADFKVHDFASRGVSCQENALIGGMAHLLNFRGTDTTISLLGAREYYNADIAGFSIPAMEHSTVTSWEDEKDAFANMLSVYAKEGVILACVSDSYDYKKAVDEIWGKELKSRVKKSGATVVIRPDSGNPLELIPYTLESLAGNFGFTNASDGKLLNSVRIIWGDGINIDMIDKILSLITKQGWSADNVNFGVGAALLQKVNRDVYSFAYKASAIKVDGKWRGICKHPVTDPSKKSKSGRIGAEYINGKYIVRDLDKDVFNNVLETVYLNGDLIKEYKFEDITD
ncbi:MAG: nicotinate phosphoribosyltransferase [Campylobacteraceae bacterium]|jgi:nicotinamide phosphoribosyltransferase|nr:nicotinate phosphoribosyltransferase [Campylobacteraceae bacterium]